MGIIICAVFNVAFDNKPAAFLGLCSAVFAAVCLVQFIYLYVRAEVQQRDPHLPVLCLFGVKGAVGISLGLGTFVVFLGLGIIDSINHKDLSLPETHYIGSVWAFGIFKWGLTAFLYALKTFRKMSGSHFQPLREHLETGSDDFTNTNNSNIQSS